MAVKSKSKAKFVKVQGKCAWAMLYWPDEYRGKKFYKISFYPDDESIQKIKSLGLMNKWYKDDGGKSGVSGDYLTFKRYTQIETRNGPMRFAPPGVYDVDGNPLITYKYDKKNRPMFDEDDDPIQAQDSDAILIGNGSEVELKLEVYPAKDGNGCRLDSIRIIDLIEYVPDEDEEEEVEEEEIKPVPKKTTTKKTTKKDAFEW